MNVVVSVCEDVCSTKQVTGYYKYYFYFFCIIHNFRKTKTDFFYTGYIQENINKDKAALL